MVQTRRKTAAAAQDGAVKENKAEPPAPQTPTKKAKRGRPPKIKNGALSLDTPSTSVASEVSNSQKNSKKNEEMQTRNYALEESEILFLNESEETSVKQEPVEKEEDSKCSSDRLSPSSSVRLPLPKRHQSNSKLKAKEDDYSHLNDFDTKSVKKEVSEPSSPVHPDDPQPSVSAIEKVIPGNVGLLDDTRLMFHATPSVLKVKEEVIILKNEETKEKSIASNTEESESMDIANSESDGEDESQADDGHPNASSSPIPLPDSVPPKNSFKREIRIEVDNKLSNHAKGFSSWDSGEEKVAANPLSSPTISRPRIHFLHPAYSSFANDSCLSPQSSAPPEPAPTREKTDNGVPGAFKMTFKKPTNTSLLKTSILDQRAEDQPSSSVSASIEASSSLSKRNSNFGTTASNELPPPQMVELPKLSFFNTPVAANSTLLSESDNSEHHVSPKLSTSGLFTTPTKYSESDIQALKAKAEKVAQDIARRHEEDKHKEGRDDYDRRRDDRDRRHKRVSSDRNDQQSRGRQREDDERRAREREREVTKRHDREREEERNQRYKEEEKRKREEEESRWKEEEERKLKEEERRIKEDGKKQKEDERKFKEEEEEEIKKEEDKKNKLEDTQIPKYDPITECIYLTKNAQKKKTESLQCECYLSGGNCSDNTCVNRAMMTECPASCRAKCKNQRFAKKKYAAVEAFHTGTEKGCGLRALKDIKKGRFIMEYIGEVVEREDYEKRKAKYAADKKHKHHYLCDTGTYTIDATVRGNASRFVNHSCDPNAVCEKWSVPKTPGDISRIGFFARRDIKAGEEISFDYQFVNYGREAQQCFCGTPKCDGWIGQRMEESPSDEDDGSDIITTRDINMDEEEEEKLEELEELEPHEKIELINNMLDDLVIKNKKHAKKVITIATRITDHGQRENLIKQIFSTETSLSTQSYYAQNGMATLMGEWLEADDYSLVNLKLVQLILQTLHGDVFVPCAKANSFLLEVLSHWMSSSLGDWVDIHVVASSLVTCTVDPNKVYETVGDEVKKDITESFNRVKEMASRLNHHWFNRSVSFKIPKKVREPVKECTSRPEQTPSSQQNENNRDGFSISLSQRQNHLSHPQTYYESRESHPRFFNNGNDVHQYRFTGYHGNNYKANYLPRRQTKDSYHDRRRFASSRRSRSRTRSVTPPSHKRRRVDDRESNRGRSPIHERRGASPEEKKAESHRSVERGYGRSEPPVVEQITKSTEEAEPQTTQVYPQEQTAMYPHTYHMPGHYPYGPYEPAYVYPPNAFYPPTYPTNAVSLAMENFPPNSKLAELYTKATFEQLEERKKNVAEELEIIIQKMAEKQVAEAIRIQALEEEARSKFDWRIAKSKDGETYYYNRETKVAQWTRPTPDQGTVEPEDLSTPLHSMIGSQQYENVGENKNLAPEVSRMTSYINQEENKERLRLPQPTIIALPAITGSPSRDRREDSRHRELTKNGHRDNSISEGRVKKFKADLEQCISSVVNAHSRLHKSREVTLDKIAWLVKLIAKEMFKRETSQNGFDFCLTENTERKVKNYTKSLIDRKLDSNDLWKGYNGR